MLKALRENIDQMEAHKKISTALKGAREYYFLNENEDKSGITRKLQIKGQTSKRQEDLLRDCGKTGLK